MLLPCYQHQNIYFPISIPIFCLRRRLNGELQNIGTAQSLEPGKNTLCDKRCDRCRILRGVYPGLSGWGLNQLQILYKNWGRGRCDTQAGKRRTQCTHGNRDRSDALQPRNAWEHQQLEEARMLYRSVTLLTPWFLTPGERIDVCRVKPPGLTVICYSSPKKQMQLPSTRTKGL